LNKLKVNPVELKETHVGNAFNIARTCFTFLNLYKFIDIIYKCI